MNKQELQQKRALQRVVTFLDRTEVDFLDKIEKDALFSSGFRLPRTKIIKALVEVLKKTHLDGTDVHSLKEFEDRFIEALKIKEKTASEKAIP